MLSNNDTKIIDLGLILKPSISEKNNSPKTISTQVSSDTKNSSQKNSKSNKPIKTPKKDLSKSLLNENFGPNYSIQLSHVNNATKNKEEEFNVGKWTNEEHEKFLEGILVYGNEWKKVQEYIKTRSSTQARSHGQKFFLRMKKLMKKNGEKDNLKNTEEIFDRVINELLPKKFIKNLTENQKEKLLSAISCNNKSEENSSFEDEFEIELDETENLNNKNLNLDNSIIIKNNKISFDLNILSNDDIFIQNNKVSIGEKRKPKKLKWKNKGNKIKKVESNKPSFDFTFYKINEKENYDDMNYLNNMGLGDNEFTIPKYGNNYEINRKNSFSSYNANNKQGGNAENKNNYIINNYINVTNNIINNKYIYNVFNPEMNNNNCFQDLYCNEKNDSIINEKSQFCYGFQNQEKCFCDGKQFLNKNEFNKIFNSDFNENKDNDFIDNENINNEADPFKLNFNNFSYSNPFNNENENQITVHENDSIKLSDNI